MKVVAAIDQSENAWEVLGSVLQTAWPDGTMIKIVSVVDSPADRDSRLHRSEEQLVRLEQTREILGLARMAVSCALPGCSVRTELREGVASDEVVLSACEWMANKIVVGSHSEEYGAMLAPVPYAVLQYSSCCVRLVRLKPRGSIGQPVVSLKGMIAKKWA